MHCRLHTAMHIKLPNIFDDFEQDHLVTIPDHSKCHYFTGKDIPLWNFRDVTINTLPENRIHNFFWITKYFANVWWLCNTGRVSPHGSWRKEPERPRCLADKSIEIVDHRMYCIVNRGLPITLYILPVPIFSTAIFTPDIVHEPNNAYFAWICAPHRKLILLGHKLRKLHNSLRSEIGEIPRLLWR